MLERPETRRSFNRSEKGGIFKIQPVAGRYNGRPFNDQGGTKNVVTRDAPWEGRGDKVFGTNLGVPQAACII